MKYKNVVKGIFMERPNRFIAYVNISEEKEITDNTEKVEKAEKTEETEKKEKVEKKENTGNIEKVHVKNTGRCKELLIPGKEVVLEKSDNPNRKTAYDLVSVYKDNMGLINIDSQAPNKIVAEWLKEQDFNYVKPEYTYGSSRIDFYMEKEEEKYLLEVKGCTLERNRKGYFPDAPTERGVKHIRELKKAANEGYNAGIMFVIQMENVKQVAPNYETHEEFGTELYDAWKNYGVKIFFMECSVDVSEVKYKDVKEYTGNEKIFREENLS